MSTFILLMALLQLKHCVLDFVLQPPYQWQNKGTYGHLGGIIHSGQHALATGILLLFFSISPLLILGIVVGEFIAHYHIDWAKMNINKHQGWTANTSEYFWWLTGIDQLLHQWTYVVILWAVLELGA